MSRVNNVVKWNLPCFHAHCPAIYLLRPRCPHLWNKGLDWVRCSRKPLDLLDLAGNAWLFWALAERRPFPLGHGIWLGKLKTIFTTIWKWFCLFFGEAWLPIATSHISVTWCNPIFSRLWYTYNVKIKRRGCLWLEMPSCPSPHFPPSPVLRGATRSYFCNLGMVLWGALNSRTRKSRKVNISDIFVLLSDLLFAFVLPKGAETL